MTTLEAIRALRAEALAANDAKLVRTIDAALAGDMLAWGAVCARLEAS